MSTPEPGPDWLMVSEVSRMLIHLTRRPHAVRLATLRAIAKTLYASLERAEVFDLVLRDLHGVRDD